MKTRSICILLLLCLYGNCAAQQVISSGGHSVKSDYSMNWILGGSLTNVLLEPAVSDDIKLEQLTGNIIPVKVYPVPANDFLKIEAAPSDTGRLVIALYNSNGIKVLSRNMPFQAVIEIKLNDIIPGTYLLKITRPAGEYLLFETKKIIKN